MIKNFFEDVKNKDKKAIAILSAVVITLIVAIVVVAMLVSGGKSSNKEKDTTTTVKETTTQEETTTEKKDEHKGMVRSQLTGKWVKKSIGTRRPVGVMLNNIIDAVPQTSIERAGVVLESPVEGGICRFEAFFEDYDDLEKIGSVRSARTYFVYYSRQFDAIYCHFGQARYALDALNSPEIDNLSGLEAVGNLVYYRTTDRVAPHNAYASADGIKAGIENKGYRTKLNKGYEGPFLFAEDGEEVELTNGKKAEKIVPGYYVNKPWFEYDKKKKVYKRFQYDGEHIDDLTGHQLKYKNIIFQNCKYGYYENSPYLNIETLGEGTGLYFTNGKYINIKWKKDEEFGQTHYYDMNGNPIVLNQGKTWICFITEEGRVMIDDKEVNK